MKKTYFNPEATVLVIASEDILTLSPASANATGFEDYDSLTDVFKL